MIFNLVETFPFDIQPTNEEQEFEDLVLNENAIEEPQGAEANIDIEPNKLVLVKRGNNQRVQADENRQQRSTRQVQPRKRLIEESQSDI